MHIDHKGDICLEDILRKIRFGIVDEISLIKSAECGIGVGLSYFSRQRSELI